MKTRHCTEWVNFLEHRDCRPVLSGPTRIFMATGVNGALAWTGEGVQCIGQEWVQGRGEKVYILGKYLRKHLAKARIYRDS